MSKCIGCGIKLQSFDSGKLGWTENPKNKYCERCFKTIHYNQEIVVNNFDNNKIIDRINKLGMFTIFITDLLNINGKLIEYYKRINNKKVLVINKCDLIPKNLKLEHIEDNIKKSYQIDEEIFFVSAKKDLYLNRIKDKLLLEKNILLCGETSSGKSTIINKLIGSSLTISHYNNTTLDFIRLSLEDYILYDTPGLLIDKDKNSYDKIIVSIKKINKDYLLNIDNIKLIVQSPITIFGNEFMSIKSKKEELKGKEIDIPDNSDIVLNNGFIYIKKGCKVLSNKDLEIRKSIIGG